MGFVFDQPRTALPRFLESFLEERVHRRVLPNGLTVLHKVDHSSKLVSAQVWVKTGSIHEGKHLGAGVSHFLEHMMFKGTSRRNGPTIAQDVQAAGGYINAYTTFDRTVYHIDIPSEETALALDVLGDMMAHSLIADEDVEREMDVIRREIAMAMDDPDRCLSRALLGCAYRTHPYRFPVIGHRTLFDRLRRKHLLKYYRSRYVPSNMVLILVGDVEESALDKLLESSFSAADGRGISPVFVPEEQTQLARREVRLEGDVRICRGAMAFKVPGIGHDDAPALDLLASVLGRGNSSVLWQALRERRQLVHEIGATCWNPAESGLFWISFVCDTEKRSAVEAAIQEEVGRILADGIPETAVEKARRMAIVSEINARKTMSGQAMRLGLAEVLIGDLGYPREYFRRIHKVTAETLRCVIERHLTDDGLSIASYSSGRQASPFRSARDVNDLVPFKKDTLPNGVRVLTQHDPRLPKVHIRVGFLGGPLYESVGSRGITAVLASMLLRDTLKRSAAEVAEAIESVGGTMNEFAGNNSFGFSLEVMSPEFPVAVDLLEQALLYPKFDEKSFCIERDGQIAQIEEDLDEIVEYGRKALRRRFFEGHPFVTDCAGDPDDLRGLTVNDVVEHFHRLCRPGNLVVGVSGDLSDGAAVASLNAVLNRLTGAEFDCVSCPFSGPSLASNWVERLPREQAVVFHAFSEPGVRSQDYHVGEVLDEMLSDMSGRLFCRVREERALAYFVGANRLSGLDTGMFALCAGTHPESASEVGEEFEREVARIRAGEIDQSELRRCKTRLKAQRRSSLQVIGARAMQAVLDELYGLPENSWMHYDQKIDAVTEDDVAQYARRYLEPARRVALTVGP